MPTSDLRDTHMPDLLLWVGEHQSSGARRQRCWTSTATRSIAISQTY